MKLTRREILEELESMGIRRIDDLKQACREYECYWKRRMDLGSRQDTRPACAA